MLAIEALLCYTSTCVSFMVTRLFTYLGGQKILKNVTVLTPISRRHDFSNLALYEAKYANLVVRATNDNIIHLVHCNGNSIPLQIIPEGIVYPQTICVIDSNVFIDVEVLLQELKMLEAAGVPRIYSRLKISGDANVVLPYHKDLDNLYKNWKAKKTININGIEPARADKINGLGIKMYDLLLSSQELYKKLMPSFNMPYKLIKDFNIDKLSNLTEFYCSAGTVLKNVITNTKPIVYSSIETKSKVVFEGNFYDTNVSLRYFHNIVGLIKPYFDENNSIPLFSECSEDEQKKIKNVDPYITSNKIGWIDTSAIREFIHLNSLDSLYVDRLDVIGKIASELGYVEICANYTYNNEIISFLPTNIDLTNNMPEPVNITLGGGWTIQEKCESFNDLPKKAKEFISVLEGLTGLSVKYISTGPRIDDIVEL